jgi:hypothetical protein
LHRARILESDVEKIHRLPEWEKIMCHTGKEGAIEAT